MNDFVLNIDGYEGPIELLLDLAKKQKVDLKHISILELADQYSNYVKNKIKTTNLTLIADFLVIASWLTYLKSRLLLPEKKNEEIHANTLAENLREQLIKLDEMRRAGEKIFSRPQLNKDFFKNGLDKSNFVKNKYTFDCTLYDLLKNIVDIDTRKKIKNFKLNLKKVFTVEEAMKNLKKIFELKKYGPLYNFSIIALSAPPTIGGSWNKSPIRIIWTPPNGSLLFLFFFNDLSIASRRSALTNDASSISIVSNSFKSFLSLKVFMSLLLINLGGNLKKEWIVLPLAFIAVIPVNAKITYFLIVFCLKYSSKVDLPLPAFPVINILLLLFSILLIKPLNSSVIIKFSGKTVPVSSFVLFSAIYLT